MEIVQKDSEKQDFYKNGCQYWTSVPPTINGMLGGFGFISETDIKGSKIFLDHLFRSRDPPNRNRALDCGAGIGRISKNLLTKVFNCVDLLEQNETFLAQAEDYIGPKQYSKIGTVFNDGLQNFKPEKEHYDVIWIQWVLGHLTDDDLVKFLCTCSESLNPNGIIVIKENVTSTEQVELDEVDSSVTRPIKLYRKVFANANLDCFRQSRQHNFPKSLYNVFMFALRPKPASVDNE